MQDLQEVNNAIARYVEAATQDVVQHIGRGPLTSDQIPLLYRALLGREPDAAGLELYRTLLSKQPELRLRDLAIIFASSPEFAAKHPTAVAESVGERLKEISVNGVQVLLPVGDAVYSQTLNTGDYEPHVAEVIRKLLSEGSTFLDLGANVGVHSQLGAQACGTTGMVYAIDASIDNCAIHSKSLRHNNVTNVTVILIALGASVKVESISVDPRTTNKIVRPGIHSSDLFQNCICNHARQYLRAC